MGIVSKIMNMSTSRSNSAADPADEATATEAIDGLSIASPSIESIRGEETLDVNEAFAKWAWDISKYADKDLDKENGRFDDAVEDIQLRLEEFEHLLEMQQRDVATCLFKQMPQLSQKFEEMERVFDGIDRLELMVARIKGDMDRVDRKLVEAESTVEGSGVLKSFVPLIFGKPSNSGGDSEASGPNFQPVRLFSADEFFPR